jgi:hypothetical protein
MSEIINRLEPAHIFAVVSHSRTWAVFLFAAFASPAYFFMLGSSAGLM